MRSLARTARFTSLAVVVLAAPATGYAQVDELINCDWVSEVSCPPPPEGVGCCEDPAGWLDPLPDGTAPPAHPFPGSGVSTTEGAAGYSAAVNAIGASIAGQDAARDLNYGEVNSSPIYAPGAGVTGDFSIAAPTASTIAATPSTWEGDVTSAVPTDPDVGLFCPDPVPNTADNACYPSAEEFPRATGSEYATNTDSVTSEAVGGEVSDPVSLVNGELVVRHTDLALGGFGLSFEHARVYRSRIDYDGPLGHGWDHTYNQRLADNGDHILLSTGNGRTLLFHRTATRATSDPSSMLVPYQQETWYECRTDPELRLTSLRRLGSQRSYVLERPTGLVTTFDAKGLLARIEDTNGNAIAFEWQELDAGIGSNQDLTPRLVRATDSVGRVIDYGYDDNARLRSVTDSASGLGARYTFLTGQLRTATDQRGRTDTYEYDGGHPDDPPPYTDENTLRTGCALACKATESHVLAGGACNRAPEDGPAACVSACESTCETNCGWSCLFGCDDACDRACSCPTRCTQYASDHCKQVWEDDLEAECAKCDDINYRDPFSGGTCQTDCVAWTFYVEDTLAYYGYGLTDEQWSMIASWCTHACIGNIPSPRLCHQFRGRTCFDECRVGFFGGNTSCTTSGSHKGCEAEARDLCNDGQVTRFNPSTGLVEVIAEVDEYCTEEAGCSRDCNLGIAGEPGCYQGCTATCSDACPDACEGCLSDEQNYFASCETACVSKCVNDGRDDDGAPRYGSLRDLNHNLLRIYDGNGDLYLENTYGQDPRSPSFDSVRRQLSGAGDTRFAYGDLGIEPAAGPADTPGSGSGSGPVEPVDVIFDPTLAHYASGAGFREGDVCTTGVCDFGSSALGPDTYVPWGDMLVVFSGSNDGFAQDFRVSAPGGGAPPEDITLELLRFESGGTAAVPVPGKAPPSTGGPVLHAPAPSASVTGETTENVPTFTTSFALAIVAIIDIIIDLPIYDPPPPPATFEIHMPSGIAVFRKRSNGTYQVDGSGAWPTGSEITLVRENSGIVRALRGRPSGLLHVSSGACARSFVGQLYARGTLTGPEASCTDRFEVSPLAAEVADPGLAAEYKDGLAAGFQAADAVLSSRDLFRATPLAPARIAVTWQRSLPPFRVDPDVALDPTFAPTGPVIDQYRFVGAPAAGLGASPSTQWRALSRSVDKAPLFAKPWADFVPNKRPIYAFHAPRAATSPALAWFGAIFDTPAPFDATIASPGCAHHIPPTETRTPDRVTAVQDAYGAVHVYYWDAQGRLLQRDNRAVRSRERFAYDRRHNTVGVEGTLGHRVCAVHDAGGDPLRLVRHGAPDSETRLLPIVQLLEYTTEGPKRLRRVSDPLDASRSVVTYDHDERGNVRSVTTANGLTTQIIIDEHGLPERIEEPSGTVVTHTYDVRGDLSLAQTTIADATGPDPMTTVLETDSAWRPVLSRGPMGLTTTWEWNADGQLGAVTRTSDDGMSHAVTYGYDGAGQRRTANDGVSETRYTYDVTGSPGCIETRAVDGTGTLIKRGEYHGPDGRLLAIINPEGTAYRYAYDGAGRLTEIRVGAVHDDPCGMPPPPLRPGTGFATLPLRAKRTYDVQGRLVNSTDGRGVPTRFGYDAHGRLDEVRRGDVPGEGPVQVQRFAYDARGQLRSTDTYDGAFATTPPPEGDAWASSPGAPVPAGLVRATAFEYDPLGRIRVLTSRHFGHDGTLHGADGSGLSRISYDYDDLTRTTSARQLMSAGVVHETTVVRDAFGRPLRVTHPTGDEVSYAYDLNARTALSVSDAPTPSRTSSELTRFTSWGAPLSIETSDGGAPATLASFAYDAFGRRTSTVSASGAASETEFDAFGRPHFIRSYYTGSSTADEIVELVHDRDGRLRFHASDAMRGTGRHTATTEYRYDELGRLDTIIRPDGIRSTHTYVGLTGLPESMTDGRGVTVDYDYDLLGSISSVTATGPTGVSQARTFAYDALGRLMSATALASDAIGSPEVTTQFRHDSLGLTTREWRPDMGEALGVAHVPDARGFANASTLAGRRVYRGLDGLGRIESIALDSPDAVAASFLYDGLGGPLQRSLGSGAVTSYTYDSLGRLEDIRDRSSTGASLAHWTFETGIDGVPRIETLSRGGDEAVSTVLETDRAGRLISETHGLFGVSDTLAPTARFEEAAALAGGYARLGSDWRDYLLDGRSNWTQRDGVSPELFTAPTVSDADAYVSFGGATVGYDERGAVTSLDAVDYEWDLFDQLRSVSGPDAQRLYTYDALGRIAFEEDLATGEVTEYGYDGLARAVRRTGTVVDVWIDSALDEHVVRVSDSGERIYFHTGRQRSPYLVTGDGAEPLEWYEFTAYGERTILDPNLTLRTETVAGIDFGLHGLPHDAGTGLVHMRARFYDPAMGRFLSPDPIGLAGGPNIYGFALGAPTMYTDPLGLSPKESGQSSRSNVICVGQTACDFLDANGVDAFSKYDRAGAPYDLPVPELVGGSLHFDKGIVYSGYEDALDAASDPNNSALQRFLSFLLAGLSSPLAWTEEYFGRTSLNIPHTIYSGADSAGQYAARGSLHRDRGQPLEATADFLHVVRDGSASFSAAGAVLSPFSKIRGRTGIGVTDDAFRAGEATPGAPRGGVVSRSLGAAESSLSIAQRGGRHSGFLKQAKTWTSAQRSRASRNFQKQIELHEGYIDNPISHVSDWGKLSSRQQQGLINHWNKEIGNFVDQQSILHAL